jgi:hypothetical protein
VTLHVLLFANSFGYIFLKAMQQLNVAYGNYVWIVPTSFGMAACEVYAVVTVAHAGSWWLVLPIGLGAGLGSMTAMYLHGRFLRH